MSSDSPQDPSDPTPPLRPPTTASSFSGDAQSPFESSPFQKGSNIVDGGPTATFSLLHVFFWMAGISIALSINNGNVMTPDMQGPMKAWMESYMAAIRIISGIGMGPLIGMLPFWYIYRRRGIQFPYHPGHWMMMHYGSSFLINAIANWLMQATGTLPDLSAQGLQTNPFSSMGPLYIGTSVALLVGGVVAWRGFIDLKRDTPMWRICFGLLTFQSLMGALGSIVTAAGIYSNELATYFGMALTGIFTGCVSWLFFILVIVAMVMDLRSRQRRDWLHWMPFVLTAIVVTMTVVWMVVSLALVA